MGAPLHRYPLVDRLSVERVRTEKIDLDDFVDECDSQHDN